MTQKKSNIQTFKSISTGQNCNAAQYIAEMVCIRRSERDNNGSLEYKFWNNSKNEQYQTQVRVASKLIKKYGHEAILHYLKNDGHNVYSLGFLHKSKKFVLPLDFVKKGIEKSKKILDQNSKKEKTVIDLPKGEYKPRKTIPQKNTLMSKLRKLDGNKNKDT